MPARKVMLEIYQEELSKARKPEEKIKVAERLFKQAMETRDDPVAKYVLLQKARDVACDAGAWIPATQVVNEMASFYQVERLTLTAITLEKANAPPAGAPTNLALQQAVSLLDEALAVDDFGAAQKYMNLVNTLRRTAVDGMVLFSAQEAAKEYREVSAAYEKAKPAFEKLAANPDDADAKSIVGKYLCVYRKQWRKGISLLAEGNDPALKAVAALELDADDRGNLVKAADAWMLLADKESDAYLKEAYRLRALHWYQEALPGLDGLSRARVTKSLEGMGSSHGLAVEFFADLELEKKVHDRVDPVIDFHWPGSPAPGVPTDRWSARWTGWICAPAPGTYKLIFYHDDGIRVYLDGKRAIDHWNTFGSNEVVVAFTKAPKSIKIELRDDGAVAALRIRWAQKDGFAEQIVPTEAWFHDRSAANKGYGGP